MRLDVLQAANACTSAIVGYWVVQIYKRISEAAANSGGDRSDACADWGF